MDLTLLREQMPVVIQALNTGFLQTLKLFFVTLAGALPLGLLISFGSMNNFRPFSFLLHRTGEAKGFVRWLGNARPIRAFFRFIIWVVRGTPLMIQLLIIFFFPGMVLHNNWWGSGEAGRFAASAVAFIFNYACYFSEIYRGGIQSVPKGQQEAGQVLGMTKRQIFFRVTLLQMVTRIVPPMSNEIITLVKDTSLARVVALQEVIWMGESFMKGNQGYAGLVWPLFFTAVYYLVFSGVATILLGKLEKKLEYFR